MLEFSAPLVRRAIGSKDRPSGGTPLENVKQFFPADPRWIVLRSNVIDNNERLFRRIIDYTPLALLELVDHFRPEEKLSARELDAVAILGLHIGQREQEGGLLGPGLDCAGCVRFAGAVRAMENQAAASARALGVIAAELPHLKLKYLQRPVPAVLDFQPLVQPAPPFLVGPARRHSRFLGYKCQCFEGFRQDFADSPGCGFR